MLRSTLSNLILMLLSMIVYSCKNLYSTNVRIMMINLKQSVEFHLSKSKYSILNEGFKQTILSNYPFRSLIFKLSPVILDITGGS
jgi:hypothetical protein